MHQTSPSGLDMGHACRIGWAQPDWKDNCPGVEGWSHIQGTLLPGIWKTLNQGELCRLEGGTALHRGHASPGVVRCNCLYLPRQDQIPEWNPWLTMSSRPQGPWPLTLGCWLFFSLSSVCHPCGHLRAFSWVQPGMPTIPRCVTDTKYFLASLHFPEGHGHPDKESILSGSCWKPWEVGNTNVSTQMAPRVPCYERVQVREEERELIYEVSWAVHCCVCGGEVNVSPPRNRG